MKVKNKETIYWATTTGVILLTGSRVSNLELKSFQLRLVLLRLKTL